MGLRVTRRLQGAALTKRALEMLDAVGLADHQYKLPEQLSGGQRQRVAIARALAAEPAMLLADEPTASLDKQSGREVVERMKTLACQNGTTILLVTHDNRILDVADRIMHLEDGKISTFTDAVIANTKHMMHTLAENRQKQPLEAIVDEMDETSFRRSLIELTQESQNFLQATQLASDEAFQSLLEQALRAFARRVGSLLNAERVSLMLIDRDTDELVVRISQDLQESGELRLPLGSGIAGAVAKTGQTIRIDDAYADSRFNQEIDKQTGFRTRSILCLPLHDQSGEVFGVTQLLNRCDDQPFDLGDEEKFAHFAESLGVILDTLQRVAKSDNWIANNK